MSKVRGKGTKKKKDGLGRARREGNGSGQRLSCHGRRWREGDYVGENGEDDEEGNDEDEDDDEDGGGERTGTTATMSATRTRRALLLRKAAERFGWGRPSLTRVAVWLRNSHKRQTRHNTLSLSTTTRLPTRQKNDGERVTKNKTWRESQRPITNRTGSDDVVVRCTLYCFSHTV